MIPVQNMFEFAIYLVAACCPTVSISASGPARYWQWGKMGLFKFYKMGSNARSIYKNSNKQYLYLDKKGKWTVS